MPDVNTPQSVAWRVATRRDGHAATLKRMAVAQADADARLAAAVDAFEVTATQLCSEYAARVRARARATGARPCTTAADQRDASAVIWAAHRRVVAAAAVADAIAAGRRVA